jgi:HlyD family secretion protein
VNRNVDTILGVVAGAALLGLGLWGAEPTSIEGPGQVTPAREYRVEHLGDGRLRWRLLDGAVPGGPVTVAEGVLVEVRGEPLGMVVEEAAAQGARIAAGTPLITVDTPGASAALLAAQAERDAAHGDLEILRAGGRPGDVAAAAAGVAVAEATLARARADEQIAARLSEQKAGAAFDHQAAILQVAVAEAELKAARASVSAARQAPHGVELTAAEHRVRAADARLDAATARADATNLRAPFAGIARRPGGDVLIAVQDDSVPLVQATLPERDAARLRTGTTGDFRLTNGAGTVSATLVAVGTQAETSTNGPVVWALAKLDSAVPAGATGVLELDAGSAP